MRACVRAHAVASSRCDERMARATERRVVRAQGAIERLEATVQEKMEAILAAVRKQS